MFYLNPPQYLSVNPAASQEMMVMKMMAERVGDGRNSDTEAWWSLTRYKVKDGMTSLITRWLVDGRKQIMLSFSSILLWQRLTNNLFVLWCRRITLLMSREISHSHNDTSIYETCTEGWWVSKEGTTFEHVTKCGVNAKLLESRVAPSDKHEEALSPSPRVPHLHQVQWKSAFTFLNLQGEINK